jgi:hypothetical protein
MTHFHLDEILLTFLPIQMKFLCLDKEGSAIPVTGGGGL